jgi:hypothetical protein
MWPGHPPSGWTQTSEYEQSNLYSQHPIVYPQSPTVAQPQQLYPYYGRYTPAPVDFSSQYSGQVSVSRTLPIGHRQSFYASNLPDAVPLIVSAQPQFNPERRWSAPPAINFDVTSDAMRWKKSMLSNESSSRRLSNEASQLAQFPSHEAIASKFEQEDHIQSMPDEPPIRRGSTIHPVEKATDKLKTKVRRTSDISSHSVPHYEVSSRSSPHYDALNSDSKNVPEVPEVPDDETFSDWGDGEHVTHQ